MKTGVSPIELGKVTANYIDFEQRLMNVTGFKGHASRTFKLKTETVASLIWYFKNYAEFPKAARMGRVWRRLK
jgi:site-specific recombinase XerD